MFTNCIYLCKDASLNKISEYWYLTLKSSSRVFFGYAYDLIIWFNFCNYERKY